jgi:hypothetical protein
VSTNQQSIPETEPARTTRQIYIGEEAYEACRTLAFERRTTIREEADRLIALGIAVDAKKTKKA